MQDFSIVTSYVNEIITDFAVFKEKSIFSFNIFNKKVDFKMNMFEEISFIRYSVFINGLNLRDSIFKSGCNFLNLSNKIIEKEMLSIGLKESIIDIVKRIKFKKNLILDNRETARIIKDSFEQQNNIIEANRFYALEMKEREKELNFSKEPFEWLVFKIHSLSSNHSQDWTLSLFWIIILGLLCSFISYDENYIFTEKDYILNQLYLGILIPLLCFTLLLSLLKFEKIKLILSTLFITLIFYLNYTRDISFNHFAYVLNPFSIMRDDEPITFGTLIFKIIIAYLIYQLIISIRQNTRRK
ncbi:hypothetical protein [Arcobacter sp.]|uniref:hypothetical protein n=1 Tax=Arcobacter sp. TaxID=1872629 RepID=UPI003C72D643